MREFKPARRILVPTDLSPETDRVIRYADAFARANRAELHLLHVVNAPPYSKQYLTGFPEERAKDILQEIANRVDAWMRRQEDRPLVVRTAIRWHASATHAILEYVREQAIDRVVMGSHGYSGLAYALMGSVTGAVARHCNVPVLVIRRRQREFVDDQGEIRLDRILYPTDLSARSEAAAPLAYHLATAYGAGVLAAHVRADGRGRSSALVGDPPQAFETAMRELFADYERLETTVVVGSPARALVELARTWPADVIVISSHGKNTLGEHLLGSVAERVLRQAPCAVCVVPGSAGADGPWVRPGHAAPRRGDTPQ